MVPGGGAGGACGEEEGLKICGFLGGLYSFLELTQDLSQNGSTS